MDKMTHERANEILGLSGTYDDETLKKAYREMVRKFHPDHGHQGNEIYDVNEAYEYLTKHPGLNQARQAGVSIRYEFVYELQMGCPVKFARNSKRGLAYHWFLLNDRSWDPDKGEGWNRCTRERTSEAIDKRTLYTFIKRGWVKLSPKKRPIREDFFNGYPY